jgi:hypothetical protein
VVLATVTLDVNFEQLLGLSITHSHMAYLSVASLFERARQQLSLL